MERLTIKKIDVDTLLNEKEPVIGRDETINEIIRRLKNGDEYLLKHGDDKIHTKLDLDKNNNIIEVPLN